MEDHEVFFTVKIWALKSVSFRPEVPLKYGGKRSNSVPLNLSTAPTVVRQQDDGASQKCPGADGSWRVGVISRTRIGGRRLALLM